MKRRPTQIRGRRRLWLELLGDPLSLGKLIARGSGKRETEGDGNSVGKGLAVAKAERT